MKNHNITLPELLAPAGSLEHLKAAVLAGADAVYFGGASFGARAYAKNFTEDAVIEGLDYAHFHDRRAYMTVNTLIKEQELQEQLYDYLLPFYEAGLDGVIVQDLGAASFIRDHFPKMEIHGSTQMMITSSEGALIAGKMGMNRVVPARELSMKEIKAIKDKTGLEIEVFIHGALCYCYSGQCLFSSMYGGRSGNRGRCAQPCRLSYRALNADGTYITNQERHLLSPKDLYSLTTLPSMIEAGVDSLKIEGRMKNVEYVAGVTAIYRKYLDLYANFGKYNVLKEDKDRLEELYSREGFTEGYWKEHNGSDMMAINRPRHMGRMIGKIQSIRKNQLHISLQDGVNPKDLLVISGRNSEEIVLTVPSQLENVMQKKGKNSEITLNAPRNQWLKPGLSVYRRYNAKINDEINTNILNQSPVYPVSGFITVKSGEKIHLHLISRTDDIDLYGLEPTEAKNRPISKEDIMRQMKKTGNVPFTLNTFDITLEDNLFVQASVLKDLRQKGYEALVQKHLNRLRRDTIPENRITDIKKLQSDRKLVSEKYAAVYDDDLFELCAGNSFFDGIILSMDFFRSDELRQKKQKIHEMGKKACISLPRVFRQSDRETIEYCIRKTITDEEKWDGIYLNNVNEFEIMQKEWYDVPRIYGASVYQWNHCTIDEILRLYDSSGASSLASNKTLCHEIPYELSAKECKQLMENMNDPYESECLVYGRFPVMLSAQCIKKTLNRCNKTEEHLFLEDQNKRRLPVSTHCHPEWIDQKNFSTEKSDWGCYNMIWSDIPKNLIGEDFSSISGYISRYKFDFFGAHPSDIKNIIQKFERWERNSYAPITMDKPEERHWNFGIE